MLTGGSSCAVTVVCLLALCGSYCQMAPAIAGAAKGWELGKSSTYELTTSLLFRETGPDKPGGDVGFQMKGRITVMPMWRDPYDSNTFLLMFMLVQPELWIKSRKAPEPEGFVKHASKFDEIERKIFYVFWKNGDIPNLYLNLNEDISLLNLEKGIISIFQYKTLDGDYEETDASGVCKVTYSSYQQHLMHKRKTSCKHDHVPQTIKHTNPLFDVIVNSQRNSTYELTDDLLPKVIQDYEKHDAFLVTRPEAGTVVISERTLKYVNTMKDTPIIESSSKDDVIKTLHNTGFHQASFTLQTEPNTCPDSGCSTLEKMLEEYRDALENSAFGTIKSATAFLKLIPLVREATVEELSKILKSTKYLTIRSQLYDLLGAASTYEAHKAAMKSLRQDTSGDLTERYLWALSLSPTPNPNVAKEILRKSEETMHNDKVSETTALTAAAMARNYNSSVMIEKARLSLELGLDSCTGEECKLKFLRALKNLKAKSAIPTLLSYAVKSAKSTSIAAWRALAALSPEHITKDVKTAAIRSFYQIHGGQRKDSTIRTLAADIILASNPTVDDLREFFNYTASRDLMYEVPKYLTQRMEQQAAQDPEFASKLQEAMKLESRVITNYNILAQKGLSTAFTRDYMRTQGSNGTLVTVQEVNAGLLKRGVVDVVLESNNQKHTLFSLGLFAGGLKSFISSADEDDSAADDDELATAGMELSLLGADIRPFYFFSGKGELMGHVWSGTASERTPAFQALVNLYRYKEYIPLSSGFIAEIDTDGAMSFDLAGQIQLSLWNKNAESLVDLSSGIVVQGNTKVRTNFVQSNAEFLLTLEPKLKLMTDVDFSGQVSLCMRLTQPETVLRYHIYKIERIAGSRHRLRRTWRSRWLSPAKSYLLNQKNNEMCSKVFSESK